MSRIIVKNLPKKANESDVRKHFETKGSITDVKVMRQRDGTSRRFAFVGFKSDAEAADAVKYFNQSFMLNSRLDVATAKALGDEELEKRKQALKRKRLEQKDANPVAPKKTALSSGESNKDSKLQEFLSVMQPQKKTAMWKNDSTELSAHQRPVIDNSGGPAEDLMEDDDEEDINDLSAPKGNQQVEESHENDYQSTSQTSEPVEHAESETVEEPDWVPQVKEEDEDEAEADGSAAATQLSDAEWLRQRQTRIKEPVSIVEEEEIAEYEEDHDVEDNNQLENEETPDHNSGDENNTKTQATNRLFLRNLSFTVTRADLEDLFRPFGVVTQVHIPVDPKTDKPKGIAFIEFQDVEEATAALEKLDGQIFQGRLLHILFGEQQRSYQLDEFDIKNMPLKKQKALKRRMQAAKQQFSWNSLYMNKDTVLDATAAKLGLTKSQLLDPTSSNMAVQQALAETSVLESVQSYFKSKGVDLTKFQAKSQDLSDRTILVKNLPYQTSPVELQDIFAAYGKVERTLMPPEGGIAIVQFESASQGRTAFSKLAFRRIGDSIMYLQKAPKGILEERAAASISTSDDQAKPESVQVTSASDILLPDNNSSSTAESAADIHTSVFVKNLNFATKVSSLAKLFQGVPGYVTAIIKQKPDPNDTSKQLSMGFGFVEFRSHSQAEAAVKALQGTELDGHRLQLKISSRGASSEPKSKSAVTTKIVIKNVPFETSKKDIVDLLGTFGQLRSVRLPRKFNRQTRGFAFAEFTTPKEAEHAMTSLHGAHLLGRRLVMDYAQADAEDPETEIARMEAKVAKQVSSEDLLSRRQGGQQKGFDMDNLEQ